MEFDLSNTHVENMVEGIDYTLYPPEYEPSPRKTPCTYKGKQFDSMTEAAEYFGVTVSAVSLYVSRIGCHRYEMPVMYKGKRYESIVEAATINDAPYSSVANWVRRHNSYLQVKQNGV